MRTLLICLFLLTGFGLQAQHLARRQYLSVDGLPSSEVYHAIEDRRGYMWFATDAGVSCFDGYRFTNYSTDNGLSENVIFQLIEDSRQRIWCRGMMGTICYFSNGAFHEIPVCAQLRRAFSGDLSNGMGIDADGTLWLSGTRHLFRIPPPYTSFTAVTRCNQYQLHEAGSTIGTDTSELDRPYTLLDEKLREFSLPLLDHPQSLAPHWSNRFHVWRRDTLHRLNLLSVFNCLYLVHDDHAELIFRTADLILGVETDPQGRIWISVDNRGILVLDPKDFRVVDELRFPVTIRLASICRDRSDGMWVTTLGNGVYYIPDEFHRQFAPPPPFNPRMTRIVPAGDRVCFTSAYDNVFFLADTSGRRPPETVALPGGERISNFAAVGSRLLIIGSANYIFDPQRHAFTPASFRPALKYAATTSDGTTYASQVNQLLRVDGHFGFTYCAQLNGQRIQCLYGGKGDTLWIGCSGGLFSFQADTLIEWRTSATGAPLRIDAITQLANGRLVLGTQSGGLLLFDRNSVQPFTQRDGLPSNFCRALLTVPGTNSVWVGMNNGIALVDCGGKPKVKRFLASSGGLPLGEIKDLCMASGRLWAASDIGAIVIDTNFHEPHYSIPLYFTSVHVNTQPVSFAGLQTLPYDSSTVDIHFTGLWFREAGAIEYRYRLRGLDNRWISTHERTIHLQSLPPGNYTLELQAFSPDGRSFSLVQMLPVTITPPFWERWWFVALVVLALAAFLYSWLRSRIVRARKDAELKQQLAETELKALRAQMNPHFVFNAISSIQQLMRTGDRETAGRYLADFSSLLRNVLEQSKNEMITVGHELSTLRLYLAIEHLRFGDNFRWQIETSAGIDTERMLIPPMLLQPFVENALWHGLLGCEANGLLRVQLRAETGQLVCVIEDNGVGRAAAAQRQNGRQHPSRGMQIVHERLETMRRRFGEAPSLEIEDLMNEKGGAAGTRVTLRIALYQLS